MRGGTMDYRGSMDFDYRSSPYGHSGDRYKSSFSSHMEKSQSMSTLPTRHSKHGFSYLSPASSFPVRDERPSSTNSERLTSHFSERPSSRQSDRYSSHFDERASSRFSDHGSSHMSDHSTQIDKYRNNGRSSSLSRDSMPSFERESSYERASNHFDSGLSIHDRVHHSLDRLSSFPRRESGFSSNSYHRDEISSRNSYDSRKSLNNDSGHFEKYQSSSYGNGLVNNDSDHSGSDTLTGSHTYGSGRYNTISSTKQHSYDGEKSSFLSDGFKNSYDSRGLEKTQRISDYDYKGSKSYSTLPRSFETTGEDRYKSTSRKSTYESTGNDIFKSTLKKSAYESTQDGRSSPMVNGTSSYASDLGHDDGERHTGWFRNHQYGPLLSKEANLSDLREDVDRLKSHSTGNHHIEESTESHMSHPDHLARSQSTLKRGSMLSKSSIQLDDQRSYRDTDWETRSSRDSRSPSNLRRSMLSRSSIQLENQRSSLDRDWETMSHRESRKTGGLLVRSLSQDRDLGYHSMRKEVPFHPPERLDRSLSETRPYNSMTNLDSTMRKSRSRTRRYQRSYGLNAGKELGVKPTVSATDLSRPDVNELGVMAYAAGYHKAKSSRSFESSKPAKIEWGKCAQLIPTADLMGVQYSEEVASNTKGLVTYTGVTNVPIVVRVHIINDRAIASDISAQVDAPGESVPISLKKISDNTVEASVLPLNEGIHTINVRCRGDLIQGCPVRIMVMADNSSFPENVKVGKITTAVVGEELQFQVDVAEAGRGELTVTISNGLHELPVRLEQNGAMFTIFTIADAVGDYNVNILWDRSPVTDEPAKLRVYDPNRVTVSGDGLTRGREDQPAKFIVDPRKAGFAEMKVSVEGPSSMAKVTMTRNEDKTYTVTYIPTEVGIFNIKVTYGGRLIYGAPFRAQITDPRRVRFAGFPTAKTEDGQIDLVLMQTYRIELETEDAGPGDLRAEMETLNAILPLQVESITNSRHAVIFTPPKEGKCVIRVRWSGTDIKGSPFIGYAREREIPIDHTKVRVRGEGITRSKVYVPSEFVLDGSQAGPGNPSVKITGTSEDVNVKIEQLERMENMYRVRYMAEKAGTHFIYVAWSDKQIPDSPFKAIVDAASSHAERVRASSMKGLIVGQACKVLIDTRDAAEGDLTAKCTGPNKAADVLIRTNEEGMYELLITPREPGLHRLDVKYGNEHIQGSPFTLRVSAAPDASKVVARGPGLNHGIIDNYNGRFICETKGAGAGQLKVRVHGPKGAFKVEMRRGSTKDRTIDIRYNPSEVGEYNITVKWSDEHVPGSPFMINIVDTERDLREIKKKHPIHPKYTSLTQGDWVEDL